MHTQLMQLACERRREMLTDAKRQRPARLQVAFLRASRRACRAERRMHQAYRTAARLRAEL
jgi:hypothetical protein